MLFLVAILMFIPWCCFAQQNDLPTVTRQGDTIHVVLGKWIPSPPIQSITKVSIKKGLVISINSQTTHDDESPRAQEVLSTRFHRNRFEWKKNITSTVFWVGEQASRGNPIANTKSSWDSQWVSSFGGTDEPTFHYNGIFSPFFTPKQNPFYCALPYNDISSSKGTKIEAPLVIPWFSETFTMPGRSVCKGRWIAIKKGNSVVYGQWEDVGPFNVDNWQYVFGNGRPSNNPNNNAGIDLSPAIRDYLHCLNTDTVDWKFVDIWEVPDGPWKFYGKNNAFALCGLTSR